MRVSELDYCLPKSLIAAKPVHPRDAAKLMIVERQKGRVSHDIFKNLGNYFKKGDVLVLNNTRVFPARTFPVKDSGGKLEVVFLTEVRPKVWEVIIGGKATVGDKITFSKNLKGAVARKGDENLIKVNLPKNKVLSELIKVGVMPLPPYIKRKAAREDKKDYQTVFAKKSGSAAAPTAGLHFTKRLLHNLKDRGVMIEYIDLAVGLGTFAPIKTQKVEDHPIHEEYYEISKKTAEDINKARKAGGRIVACGTTVVRALESAAGDSGSISYKKGMTKLFIYPGYKFKAVDCLITNFHTPRSSLLALVFAFGGKKHLKDAYKLAVRKKYRFFSYGDAMLIY